MIQGPLSSLIQPPIMSSREFERALNIPLTSHRIQVNTGSKAWLISVSVGGVCWRRRSWEEWKHGRQMEKMMSLEMRCRLLSHFFFLFFPSPIGEVPTGVQPCVETANLTHVRTMDFKEHVMEKPEGEMMKRNDRKIASKILPFFFNFLGQK